MEKIKWLSPNSHSMKTDGDQGPGNSGSHDAMKTDGDRVPGDLGSHDAMKTVLLMNEVTKASLHSNSLHGVGYLHVTTIRNPYSNK